jgi:hypothetical protein
VAGTAKARLDVLTSWHYIALMSATRRATVYLVPELHRALRLKAAETDQSISDLVNAAIRQTLAEDDEDLTAVRARAKEPNLEFESVLKDLRRRGKL